MSCTYIYIYIIIGRPWRQGDARDAQQGRRRRRLRGALFPKPFSRICQNHYFCSDPISTDRICPFRHALIAKASGEPRAPALGEAEAATKERRAGSARTCEGVGFSFGF